MNCDEDPDSRELDTGQETEITNERLADDGHLLPQSFFLFPQHSYTYTIMSLSSVYANLEAASNDRNPSQVKAAIREAKVSALPSKCIYTVVLMLSRLVQLALLQSNLLILNTQQSGRDVEQARKFDNSHP